MNENDILVYMKEKALTMARLGDLEVDPAGFQRFAALKKETADLEIFSKEGMMTQEGEIDQDKALAESYGLSAVLIDMEWAYVKSLDKDYIKGFRIPFDEEFWIAFQNHCMEMLGEGQDYLLRKLDRIMELGPDNWDSLPRAEKIILRYLFIKQQLGDRAGFPSFKDLVTFYTRFAKVAYDKFEVEKGRVMTPEEFTHVLQHPSFNTRLVTLMNNHRDYGIPAVTTLHEGGGMGVQVDLNRIDVFMDPAFFEIREDGGGPVLHIKDDFLDQVRKGTAAHVDKLHPDAKPTILRCPVVYTAKFPEMAQWMFEQLAYHLNFAGESEEE
ncbi:MAG: hypothetical protein RJB39_407 [Candidatus Parcubacteria bacterium]|jgi:hypothetical protein